MSAVQAVVGEFGVIASGYVYALKDGQPQGWGTSPPTWRNKYFDKGLAISDPGYRRGTRPVRPTLMRYDQGYPGLERDATMQAFCEELRFAGHKASLFLPDMTPAVSGVCPHSPS